VRCNTRQPRKAGSSWLTIINRNAKDACREQGRYLAFQFTLGSQTAEFARF
jgi:hypothetical protein